MISVSQSFPGFAQRCEDLEEGASAYSIKAEIPFDLHRYRDGWFAYWKNPPDGQLGRHMFKMSELLAFLHGNFDVGEVIPSKVIRKVRSRKAK